jgi:RHS repeat-associated protein
VTLINMEMSSPLCRNYVTADGLDTPRVLTSSTGTVIWSWSIKGNPFGDKMPAALSGYAYHLRFAGQYYDAESGLYYNVRRYYAPGSGRYRQMDPIGYDGGQWSLLAYGNNNPLSNVDPLGLWSVSLSAYLGFGGGVTIGRDGVTGEWFYGGNLGVGIGAGLGLDPKGSRPGAGVTTSPTGTTVGVHLDASAQFYYWNIPLASGQAGVDVNSGEFYGDGPYPDPSAGYSAPIGIGAGFSVSVEVFGHHEGCAR